MNDPQYEIQEIVRRAEADLDSAPPTLFSPAAYSLLKKKISEYVGELINESLKVSKRRQSDMVSVAHVERASEYLIASTGRRLFRHIGTVGGIFLGAAISNLLTMTSANQFSTLAILVTTALGIVGAFMIALFIAKD
jgi:hypothetical protein